MCNVHSRSAGHQRANLNMQSVAGHRSLGRSNLGPILKSPVPQRRAIAIQAVGTETRTRKGTTSTSNNSSTTSKQRTRSGTSLSPASDEERPKSSWTSRFYTFITGFPFPLGPAFIRDTIRREVRLQSCRPLNPGASTPAHKPSHCATSLVPG